MSRPEDHLDRLILTAIDAGQTSQIRGNSCLEEMNPIGRAVMGKNPSNESILLYFVGGFMLESYLEQYLKDHGAPKWLRRGFHIMNGTLRIGAIQNNQYWLTDVWNDPAIDHHRCKI